MHDMAMLLDKEFGPQGYNVPTTVMPGFVLSIAGLFDKDLRLVHLSSRELFIVYLEILLNAETLK